MSTFTGSTTCHIESGDDQNPKPFSLEPALNLRRSNHENTSSMLNLAAHLLGMPLHSIERVLAALHRGDVLSPVAVETVGHDIKELGKLRVLLPRLEGNLQGDRA